MDIAATRAEADAAVLDMLRRPLGSAGARVVIEEFVHGEEALAVRHFRRQDCRKPFGAAQDHKRAWATGDKGPNTGGMGTSSCRRPS
ncbi:hypothetical protein ACRAWD_04225 [Caulobacter segnis]